MEFNYIPSGNNDIDRAIKIHMYLFADIWSSALAYFLNQKLDGSEIYEVYENTSNPSSLHKVIKYKNFYIDVRGIFTRSQLIKHHLKDRGITCTKVEIIPQIEKNIPVLARANYVGTYFDICAKFIIDSILIKIERLIKNDSEFTSENSQLAFLEYMKS